MAKLSKAAIALLESAGCNEIADDYIVLGDGINVTVLLSHRAVADLNRQASGDSVDSTRSKEKA